MTMDLFSSETLIAAEAYLGRLSRRQQVIASNLANIDTPGYRTKDISFHATLQELLAEDKASLRRSGPGHFTTGAPMSLVQPFEVEGLPARADNNNVDVDREMLKLSETSFGYTLMTQIIRGKFHTIASSINEGRV
ncbi:MAG: flagellar basal body rod protein FlgB [Acidobacteria bacterium]|nr:flagellar basal body rod protein FlgB [Acidobacteriota bacterium]